MLLTASGSVMGSWPRSIHGPFLVHLGIGTMELTNSNQFMKVQLAKLKADQEKAGKKGDHRVSQPPPLPRAKAAV